MICRVVYRCKYKPAPLLGLDRYWGFQFVIDKLMEDQYARIKHEDTFKYKIPYTKVMVVNTIKRAV